MLNNAIEKIKNEIDKSKNDMNIKYIGEFLIEQLNLNPQIAEKILMADKTIKGAINEMRKVAEKRQVNCCGMLTPQEGFGIVIKYFEIDTNAVDNLIPGVMPVANEAEPVESKKESKEDDFSFSLEDFIK